MDPPISHPARPSAEEKTAAIERSSVTVVLGGGGAKGIVHIGVLKAVDAEGLAIEAIVGTSIGAIWAALFAKIIALECGGAVSPQSTAIASVERIAYQLRFKDYRDLNTRRLFRGGLIRGDKFAEWLTNMFWHRDDRRPLIFADIPFDLKITATNAATGESVLFDSRRTPTVQVATAVRASMSIPGFFCDVAVD